MLENILQGYFEEDEPVVNYVQRRRDATSQDLETLGGASTGDAGGGAGPGNVVSSGAPEG